MGTSYKNKAEHALSSNIQSVITETFGQVTPETALKYAALYCLNRRMNHDSIRATLAPFQHDMPMYVVLEWSLVVRYITYVIWIRFGFIPQNYINQ